MEKRRHSQKEINALLTHADELAAQGKLQKDIARTLGVSVMTLHRWRKAGPGQHGAQRAQQSDTTALIEELERENARLRVLLTDLLLEKARLEETLQAPKAGRVRHMLGRRAARA